jgi:methionine-rich copper-binding protein CopC
MRKVFMSIAVLVGLLFLQIPGAWAHAQTTATFPKNNAVLTTMPKQVWFEFDGNLTVLEGANVNSLVIKDSTGKQLQETPAVVAGARIIASIIDTTASGKIMATYRVVSEDGHPVEGSIVFTVLTGSAEVTPASPRATTKAKAQETKAAVSPTATVSPTPDSTDGAVLVDKHVHHNFFQRHTDHFIQFGVGFAVIGIWFIYERRRKK